MSNIGNDLEILRKYMNNSAEESHFAHVATETIERAQAEILRLREQIEGSDLIPREMYDAEVRQRKRAEKEPHRYARRAMRAEARVQHLENAINWALGCNGEFRDRMTGEGMFYWRNELAARASMQYNADEQRYVSLESRPPSHPIPEVIRKMPRHMRMTADFVEHAETNRFLRSFAKDIEEAIDDG